MSGGHCGDCPGNAAGAQPAWHCAAAIDGSRAPAYHRDAKGDRMAGHVQTVLGSIPPEAMGVTLPHEHLLIDFKVMFGEPDAASDKGRAWEPVSLANLGWVRRNFNANLDNLRLTDETLAADEIRLFKHAGG